MRHRRVWWALAVVALLAPSATASAAPCAMPDECPSGFCVDGVCCDTACTGECQGCSAAAKGGGADGECGPIPEGTLCLAAHCEDFDHLPDRFCDAAGVCADLGGAVSCYDDDPCTLELCDDPTGCGFVLAADGTPCGDGLTCGPDGCGPAPPTSSASSTGSGEGGSIATGGGVTSAAGVGGGGGESAEPADEGGCSCGAAGAPGDRSRSALALALGLAAAIRSGAARRWARRSGRAGCSRSPPSARS